VLLKRLSGIEKPQLSNLKSHLYKQVLASLRLLKSTESIDLQLHEAARLRTHPVQQRPVPAKPENTGKSKRDGACL
jgi:hypothetical protein